MFKQSVCIIAILTFSVLSTTAQTQKGSLMLGGSIADGNLGGGASGMIYNFRLNPKVGYFVTDNLAVGVGGQFGMSRIPGYRGMGYGLSPFARYYFGRDSVVRHGSMQQKRLRFFTEADFGYSMWHARYDGSNGFTKRSLSGSDMTFSAGGGMTYFITPNIGLETSLKLRGNNNHPMANGGLYMRPELSVGLQIYLPRRSKK